MIVDSPIRSPEEEARHPLERPPMGNNVSTRLSTLPWRASA